MSKAKRKGFTLVELLAVIVILSIILVIAVPSIMSTITESRKGALESSAKLIAGTAETAKLSNDALGIDREITCEDVVELNSDDYASCKIKFVDGKAKVKIIGKGKFEGINVCEGTKENAEATEEACLITPVAVNCTFDGELTAEATYVNGPYTYTYQRGYKYVDFGDIGIMLTPRQNIGDGWSVKLTDSESNDNIDSEICTSINDKNVISTAGMFYQSKANKIDLSSFDSSNIVDMQGMFDDSDISEIIFPENFGNSATDMRRMFIGNTTSRLNLSNLNTSKVTNMSEMFSDCSAGEIIFPENFGSAATRMDNMFMRNTSSTLDLSNLNTSKVTDMSEMFTQSSALTLDLSSFDTSSVTSTTNMFADAAVTTGYARTQDDADKFNSAFVEPNTLIFIVK